jgi:hypothetical protein
VERKGREREEGAIWWRRGKRCSDYSCIIIISIPHHKDHTQHHLRVKFPEKFRDPPHTCHAHSLVHILEKKGRSNFFDPLGVVGWDRWRQIF